MPTRLNHDPYRRRVLDHHRQLRRADALTADAAARGDGLDVGDQNKAVLNVKKHLAAAGYGGLQMDDHFGASTVKSVKAFQRHSGLQATGVVDPKTWAKLDDSLFEAKSATSPAQSRGERGAVVKRSEQLLKKLGYGGVTADGFFDGKTTAAVKKFQQKQKLEDTGRINQKTLTRLKKAAASGGTSEGVKKFIEIAKKQIGDPYVFGASGPGAFDCSGLIYYALKQAGVDVPRLTARGYQDHFKGSKVSRENLKPGDLVYLWYPNDRGIPRGQASHIEIYLGNGKTMGTDNPSEGARIENIDWSAFLGGTRVPGLYR